MQGWLERVPGTRKAVWTLAVAQMTSSLATLLSSGIDEDAAMGLCLEQIGHEKLKSVLGQCREEMQQGKGLADTLMRHSVLPGLYGRMLVSAAETGNLSSAMERIAQQMEEDAEAQLSDLIDQIEQAISDSDQDITFSSFVIQACEYALDHMDAPSEERN